MQYSQLRIVSNGKKFRIQALKFNSYNIYVPTENIKRTWFFKLRVVFEKEKRTKESWVFLGKDGSESREKYAYVDYVVEANPVIEFPSKEKALSWIKNKWGEEGLDLICKEENWMPV